VPVLFFESRQGPPDGERAEKTPPSHLAAAILRSSRTLDPADAANVDGGDARADASGDGKLLWCEGERAWEDPRKRAALGDAMAASAPTPLSANPLSHAATLLSLLSTPCAASWAAAMMCWRGLDQDDPSPLGGGPGWIWIWATNERSNSPWLRSQRDISPFQRT
jgi:hypothetical protein